MRIRTQNKWHKLRQRSSSLELYRQEKRILALMIIVLIFFFSFTFVVMVNSSRISFIHEEDTHAYSMVNLPTSIVAGRTVYNLALGILTPDQGVQVSFNTALSLSTDYQVQVLTSDEQVLFQDTRNTAILATIFPDRVANLTMIVTPYCVKCSFTGYEGGDYTFYSIAPYFEFKLLAFFSGSIALSSFLEWIYLTNKRRYSHNRMIYYLGFSIIILAFLFSSWYWYAYGAEQWYIAAIVGVAIFAAEQILAYLRRQSTEPKASTMANENEFRKTADA